MVDVTIDIIEESDAEDKEQKLKEKRQRILNDISNCNFSTQDQKIAWLLNHKPETRNSDVELQIQY